MECLAELVCATGQGYLFARPLPADELTSQLIASFGLDETGQPPVPAAPLPI